MKIYIKKKKAKKIQQQYEANIWFTFVCGSDDGRIDIEMKCWTKNRQERRKNIYVYIYVYIGICLDINNISYNL